jgi:putative ABC transport system permease protein
MTLHDLLGFSGGALRGHRLRSGLSLLGVAIGVGSVILLTSLGEGARTYVVGEFVSMGNNLLLISPGKIETTGGFPIFGGVARDLTVDDWEAIVRQVPQIRRAAPVSMGEAPARFGSKQRDVTVIGTTVDMKNVRQLQILSGRYLPAGDPSRAARLCVIGFDIKNELFGGGNPLGEWLRLGEERYRVIGILGPRGVSLGIDLDEVIHVPVARSMEMFNRTGLFAIWAEVGSLEQAEAGKEAALALLQERHEGFEDVTITTQGSMMTASSRILAALTAALGGIAAISLAVAGIGIMNVMLVSVSERVTEIGLLKALGAKRGQIIAVFLVEASILTTAGGMIGLALGYAGGRLIMLIWPAFPVQPPLWAVIGALTLALLVGLTFGLLPARRAAGLDPVASLARR